MGWCYGCVGPALGLSVLLLAWACACACPGCQLSSPCVISQHALCCCYVLLLLRREVLLRRIEWCWIDLLHDGSCTRAHSLESMDCNTLPEGTLMAWLLHL